MRWNNQGRYSLLLQTGKNQLKKKNQNETKDFLSDVCFSKKEKERPAAL